MASPISQILYTRSSFLISQLEIQMRHFRVPSNMNFVCITQLLVFDIVASRCWCRSCYAISLFCCFPILTVTSQPGPATGSELIWNNGYPEVRQPRLYVSDIVIVTAGIHKPHLGTYYGRYFSKGQAVDA